MIDLVEENNRLETEILTAYRLVAEQKGIVKNRERYIAELEKIAQYLCGELYRSRLDSGIAARLAVLHGDPKDPAIQWAKTIADRKVRHAKFRIDAVRSDMYRPHPKDRTREFLEPKTGKSNV